MGTALAAITRACTALGLDRSHPLIESLLRLDNERPASGGGSSVPVFYATNFAASPFAIPARAAEILVAADTSLGNVRVVLPVNPQAGDVVRLKTTGSGRAPGVTSLSSVADTIDGSSTWPTGLIVFGNLYADVNVMFQPNGVGGAPEWSVISDYAGQSALPP